MKLQFMTETRRLSPGEWIAHEDDGGIGIYMREPDGTCGPQVAQVILENLVLNEDLDQARSDAMLIAAAPRLLAALRYIAFFSDAAIAGNPTAIRKRAEAAVSEFKNFK